CRHGQRLPGPARLRMDGPHIRLPGPDRRRRRSRRDRPGAQGRLPGRYHLRPEQRVRLRLPARQHEVQHRGLRPARAQLRDRGRSGFDSDRRGAHAADHLPRLKPEEHYTIDEKMRTVALTEDGVTRVEQLLGVENLYDPRNILLLHHANQGLRAHTLFKRDVDYVVKEGEVIIVDEFTGRLMPGRRWSDGLHQAVEAKENVKIESENQTLATITFQNYFRMYKKLSGMTGTADTEAVEFKEIYGLDVVVIPTNQPMIRIDNHDVVYKTEDEKFDAVIEEIRDC